MKVTPSQERALKYLKGLLAMPIYPLGSRLPPCVSLARQAHVAVQSMHWAIRKLVFEKHLSSQRRLGIFVGQTEIVSPLLLKSQSRWQEIRHQIENDIREGRLPHQPAIPSFAALEQRYGVSYATLRKAIAKLEQEMVLEKHHRSWRLKLQRDPKTHASLLVIGPGDKHGVLQILSQRWIEGIANLRATGLQIEMMGHTPSRSQEKFLRRCATLLQEKPILGAIIWPDGESRAALLALIPKLQSIFKHCVFIDDRASTTRLPSAATLESLVSFRMSSQHAGVQMGRFLLELGHRKVAYLSCYHAEAWSVERERGLNQALIDAGFPKCLSLTLPQKKQPGQWNDFPEVAKLAEMRAALFEPLQIFFQRLSLPYLIYDAEAGVHETLEHAKNTLSLQPLLKQLQKNPEITAVVAGNDAMAICAYGWLTARGRRIPSDLSLVSFDDSNFAYDFNLTSYNFDFGGMLKAAANGLVGNLKKQTAFNPSSAEWDGKITERGSSQNYRPSLRR